ncbi:MAG: cell wall hydrolase [Hyphomonadaceae bacterium]|nr:cell wall hydrolase [Hyphomonadaceae bacterium]
MVEIERNPLAMRQGAATIVCIAAAAVAMPVISHRAAEQREGAEWAARSVSFQAELQNQLLRTEPTARVELTAYRTADGLRARGQASLFTNGADTHAMLVQAALRGPLAPLDTVAPRAPAAQSTQQVNARELGCLSQAIYYESRGESYEGQVAVAEVVMNRVRSPAYPNTICGVVYQGSHRVTGCQFSFTCDGSLRARPRGAAWTRAQEIASQVMQGYARPMTQRATHYHTVAVNPVWSSGLVETTRIGSHIFYRFPNRSERATYQAALATRLASASHGRRSDDLIPAAVDEAMEAEAALADTQLETNDAPALDAKAASEAADAPISTVPGEVAT